MRILLALALVFAVTACSGTAAKQTTPQDVVTAIQAAGLTANNPRVMDPGRGRRHLIRHGAGDEYRI